MLRYFVGAQHILPTSIAMVIPRINTKLNFVDNLTIVFGCEHSEAVEDEVHFRDEGYSVKVACAHVVVVILATRKSAESFPNMCPFPSRTATAAEHDLSIVTYPKFLKSSFVRVFNYPPLKNKVSRFRLDIQIVACNVRQFVSNFNLKSHYIL